MLKTTGKYFVPSLARVLKTVPPSCGLLVQSRRDVHGQNSELFGGATHVVEHVMHQVTTSVYRPNMERALLHERERTRGDASRTCELPQLPLDWNVTGTRLRAGSGMLYEYL